MFDKTKFMSFYKGTVYESSASRCWDAVYAQLAAKGAYSEMAMVGIMATVRTEVGRYFKPIPEIADGSAYEGRADLGNTIPGDGRKYKGRGYIQLTGRANYTQYGMKLDLDLVNYPDIALAPYEAAQIIVQYFADRGVNLACNRKDWMAVRKLVNGGTNGIETFKSVVNQYLL